MLTGIAQGTAWEFLCCGNNSIAHPGAPSKVWVAQFWNSSHSVTCIKFQNPGAHIRR